MSRRPDPEATAAARRHRARQPAAAPQAAGMAVAAGLGGSAPGDDLVWQPIGGAGPAETAGAAAAPGWEAAGPGSRTAGRRDAAPRRGPLPPPVLALLVGALDLALLSVAGLLAALVLADPLAGPMPVPFPAGEEIGGSHAPAGIGGALAAASSLVLVLAAARGAYRPAALFSLRRQMRALLPALLGAAGFTAFAAAALGAAEGIDLRWGGMALTLAALALVLGRGALTALMRSSPRARAAAAPRAVILAAGGDGRQAERLVALLTGPAGRAVRLLGIVDGGLTPRASAALRIAARAPLLGPMDTLLAMLREGEVDQVILAMPWVAEARGLALLRRLGDYAVDIRLAPDLLAWHGRGEVELTPLADRPIAGWAALFKAAEDYLLALAALALTAVPMALIALAIRLDSPGPVLFRQRRIGLNGRPFDVLKFRTMYHDAADPTVRCQVREGDPRITPVGALLRRTSLDELPQIFNVLRGEMSVVGPRPHAPGTRAGEKPFEEVTPLYAARHRVKPGLTGLAQVRGWRGPTETEEKLIRRVESDLEYIENWSPWLDVAIILRTLVAVARMRNAC
ncbi:hypothetical protein GCM10010964_06340 [Caldovatus sediminis]|uniref:Bacterial sugar transferase domain-containing protein n=1 Tax=Caldovatus sediminis TaxID=2041189 RepID=A0A8J2Z8I9_9PROT|nr:exopolysaccharide biosynthesis polyprenyl glycosylphosphotransferase [Caldovatus sediminis]GGG20871.1 hypothetical protein GCM10010964_06340 [Caldovatus sediminis]